MLTWIIGTACPNIPVVISLPLNLLNFHFPHVDWAVPYFSFLLHFQLHVTIYWSNSPLKPWIWSNQNPKILKNHFLLLNYHDLLRLQHLLPLRHLKNLNSSSNIELLQWNPEWSKDGTSSFQSALAAKDVELSDLDFGLQQELRASPQARADSLAPDITAPDAHHYDPDKWKLQKIDLTKRRPFTDLQ